MSQAALLKLLAQLSEGQAVRSKAGRKAKAKRTDWSGETMAAFTKAGFKDVQPKVNVLTFRRWEELGRRPSEGTHGVKVGPFTLFHISQTRPLAGTEWHKDAVSLTPDHRVVAAEQPKPVTQVIQPKAEITEEMIEVFLANKAKKQAESAALEAEFGPKV